ncbi:MAG: DUF5074 domain-containing protein [Bacteroidia bacterium]
MKHLKYILLLAGLTPFFSCQKDSPNDPATQTTVTLSGGQKVYVLNEGNFGSGNASVSLYEPSSGQVVADYYKSQNNSAVLGDVCESMIKANNSYYIVVNNSGKIVVVNTDDFKIKGTVTGLPSPRYILPITFQKAYVSDFTGNAVSIIDLNTFSKTGSINCPGWTEDMEVIYNKAFITNMKRNYTYVVNTVNDQIIDSINTGINAGSAVLDRNEKLWILGTGDKTNSIPGKLMRVDPVTLQVELTLGFSANDAPNTLCINGTKDTLYFINNHVFRMPISANTLPATPFITSVGNTFYGIGINYKDQNIYISDALDYVQKSTIMVYTPQGQLKTTFKSGIISSHFYFE